MVISKKFLKVGFDCTYKCTRKKLHTSFFLSIWKCICKSYKIISYRFYSFVPININSVCTLWRTLVLEQNFIWFAYRIHCIYNSTRCHQIFQHCIIQKHLTNQESNVAFLMRFHKKFAHLDCCKLRAGFLTLYGYFAPCPKHLHSMMMIGERDSLFTQKFSPCFPTLFRIDIINKMRGALLLAR